MVSISTLLHTSFSQNMNIFRGDQSIWSRISICYYSVRIQWNVKPIFAPKSLMAFVKSMNLCFIWDKNQCKITSCHFSCKFKYPFNPSQNFWVISARSQSMRLILGQKPVKSRLGCSVWPKSWSLSRYFLGYDDIAWSCLLPETTPPQIWINPYFFLFF